jgi:hypothetical protein
MTTKQFSYALKSKLPGSLCLIIIGTEGRKEHVPAACRRAIHVQRVAALRDMLAVA